MQSEQSEESVFLPKTDLRLSEFSTAENAGAMKVLVVVPNYPYPGYRFSGIFNEKSVRALSKLCGRVDVLAPRPYVPPLLSALVPRWKAYGTVPRYESENGISVYRPTIPVVPGIAQAFWSDQGAYLWCRQMIRRLHSDARFDVIISFDLMGAGGVAWRVARDLGIPASGWATGGDVRVPRLSSHGRAVVRALKNLDLVFYQNYELLEKAAGLLGISPEEMSGHRHRVLPRGIPEPPQVSKTDARNRKREEWGVKEGEVVILYLGRILRQKGMLELLEAVDLAAARNSRIRCVLIGSKPGFDDTAFVEEKIHKIPRLRERVTILPECKPDDIWENFCAADIFAFPSHNEGMPNSLLEAMAMGVPAIAFAIPAVRELEANTGALVLVPPLDANLFAEAISSLAGSPEQRLRLGKKGKALVMDRFMMRKSMAEALRGLNKIVNGGDSALNERESHGGGYAIPKKGSATSKTIKVAHLSSVHPPFDIRVFHKECVTLAKAGYDTVLIVPHNRHEIVDGVRVRAIPKPTSRWRRMLTTTWQVFRAALDENADVYHFHDPELIPVGLLLRLLQKRVVYDVHEEVPKQILNKYWIPPWLRGCVAEGAGAAERLGALTFNGIVAATPAIASRFPKKKTSIVQNFPIPGELVSASFLPYTERSFSAVYVGVIATVRGIQEIVHAMAMMPQRLQAKLVLAGDFDPPELQDEVRRIGGWESVDFLAWQSREGIARILGLARVGLVVLHPLPNFLESYPIKLFEYMSAGIPVVASDFPLWRKIIQEADCGLLVDPLNPEAIAEAIQWLFQHEKEAEAMGARGREAVSSRFSWSGESEELLNLYRTIFPARFGAIRAETCDSDLHSGLAP